MPIILSPPPAAVSSAQALSLVTVFDYEYDPSGNPLVDARVGVTLQANQTTNVAPLTNLDTRTMYVLTDRNGFWSISLVPNVLISPANTVYSVQTPVRSFDIQITAAVGPYQASSLSVTTPATLPVGTTTLNNPLSVTGLLTASGGLSVTGAVTFPAASIPLADISPTPATDSLAVHLAGAESITGIKTFSANPVFNTASIPIADVTPLPATDSLAVHLAGAETITGAKTFNANPVFNAAAIPEASLAQTHAWGTLGYAQITSTFATNGAQTDVTGLAVTVTVGTGRRIRVTGYATSFTGNQTNDAVLFSIYEGATELQRSQASENNIGQLNSCMPVVLLTPSAGTHTYKLSMIRIGTGTAMNLNAATVAPAFIHVEDIGV